MYACMHVRPYFRATNTNINTQNTHTHTHTYIHTHTNTHTHTHTHTHTQVYPGQVGHTKKVPGENRNYDGREPKALAELLTHQYAKNAKLIRVEVCY